MSARGKPKGSSDSVEVKLEDLVNLMGDSSKIVVRRRWLERYCDAAGKKMPPISIPEQPMKK